jgi:hypothetical protein
MLVLYTFEVPTGPVVFDAKPEILRLLCSSEEEAWTRVLQERPGFGALAELIEVQTLAALTALIKSEPPAELTQTEAEILEMYEFAMRALMGAGAI